jgi:hypothetical protein
LEYQFIQNGWLAVTHTINGYEELALDIPSVVRDIYQKFLSVFKKLRQLPSLAYYSEELKAIAEDFKQSIERKDDIETLLKKDVEFHECIFNATNNTKLSQIINTLWEQVHRFRTTYISDFDAPKHLVEEHNNILNAIISGDNELAKKYAIDHIEKAEQFMIEKSMNK